MTLSTDMDHPARLTLFPHGAGREWSSKQYDDWKADMAHDYVSAEAVEVVLREVSSSFAGAHINADVVLASLRRRLRALTEGKP